MNTKIFTYRFFVFLLISLFTVTSCQPQTATEQQAATDTPASNATDEPTNNSSALSKDIFLDPAITQNKDALLISQYVYEGLVTLDDQNNPQPGVAESWVVSDDQLDYVFTLRPGATFSDGTPISPDIIVDNFNRWFDPKNPLHKDGEYLAWQTIFLGFLGEKDADKHTKSTVDGIQKVDSNTVLLHLSRIEPNTLTYLANPAFAILNTNAVALGGYGTRDSKIISSGAYIVSSWTADEITLSPNPNYWGEAPTSDLNFTLK